VADRSITIALEAKVQGFVTGMRTAQKAADDFGSRTMDFAKNHEQSLDRVGKAGMIMGGGLLAGVGVAVKAFMEFDKAMSEVQASTHASAGDMDMLRQAAIEAGADTAFSAAEAAKAIDEMAKAGVSTADILGGGLAGSLALAAAGSLDVGEAAEIAATAMTQFKLSGKDLPHIADLLAAGAGKAQGSVQDMGMALKQAGLVAASTGLSIEETTGGLAAFASAGLIGSDAGTSFKSMLQRLTPQSAEAKNMMAELGISAYDAQGQFIGLSKFSDVLKNSMKDLTPEARSAAMGVIFGSDAVRAANVLYEQGAAGIDKWTAAVNDAGFAAETAALKQDNLAGDFEKLTGSIDSVFLKSASGANTALRGLVQGAEDLVDAIGDIPAPVLQAGLGIAGISGVMLLVGGAFLTALPKIQDGVSAFRDLQKAAPGAASALKGAAIAGVIISIGVALGKIAEAKAGDQIERSVGRTTRALVEMASQRGNIEQTTKALDHLFKTKDGGDLVAGVNNIDSALTRLFKKDFLQSANDWGNDMAKALSLGSIDFGTEKTLMDSFKAIDDQLAAFVSSGNAELAGDAFKQLEQKARDQGISLEDLRAKFPGYFEALKQADADARVAASGMGTLTTSTGAAIPITEEMQKALDDLGISAQGRITDLDKYAAALVRAGLSSLSSSDAARNYLASIDAVDAAIKSNGTTLDTHTEKGRANEAALLGIASAGLAEVQVMAKATDAYGNHINTSDTLHAKMMTTYNDLVANAAKFGITGDAADTLARKALGIPDNVDIQSYLKDFASQELDRLGAKAANLNGTKVGITIGVNTIYTESGPKPEGYVPKNGIPAFHATGGRVNYLAAGGRPRLFDMSPRGTDTVPAMLTPGEYVVNAKATAANLATLEAINAGMTPAMTYRPAPVAVSAPAAREGVTFGDVTIVGQSDPVATFHEFSRRTNALAS
jgi:TP901 family phage tail tape measure protein